MKDALDWIARYGAESARARAELPMRFDVAYGAHHDERLDVFAAARPGTAPIQISVDIKGVKELVLHVDFGEDRSGQGDFADWALARIIR